MAQAGPARSLPRRSINKARTPRRRASQKRPHYLSAMRSSVSEIRRGGTWN